MAKAFTLPPEKVAELKADQRQLHDLLTEFDKLEECGGDCAAWRAQHAEAMARVDALLRNYGPPIAQGR